MFPMEESPYLWPACDDAYHFTWIKDPTEQLTSMDALNVARLARSAGFCPHSRCQLDILENSVTEGLCPTGLCYTKLEVPDLSYEFVSNEFQ